MKRLHELLKEKRLEKRLTLETIEKSTKIKKVFLQAIEEGRYSDLPSESYARGFVKNYAHYLGIPEYKVVPMFRREYESEHIDFVPGFRKTQHRFQKSSIFSGKGLLIIGVILVITAFVAFQYSSLFLSPSLTITQPGDRQIISSNVINVEGKTDPYATVLVDGEEVYVGVDGKFRKSIYAFTGEKKITVSAKNRFGKQTRKIISVKVK